MNDKQFQNMPFVPKNMPFNGKQKQWLAGFLTGLRTRFLNTQDSNISAAGKSLTIIYGSQTGNAEGAAEDAAQMAKAHGMTATVIDMDDADLNQLSQSERLFIITSTYGEGEMPDNAQGLWDDISADNSPSFSNTYFSVLALGDTGYDDFCLAGKLWDERLEALGGQRIHDRVDCDVDYDEPAETWMSAALPIISVKGSQEGATAPINEAGGTKKVKSKYTRKTPLFAELTLKKNLSGEGSSKQIMHYEFSLAGSGETYNAGDALNIIPQNRPDLIEELLELLNAKPEQIEEYKGETKAFSCILRDDLEIRTPSKEFLAEFATRSGHEELNRQIENNDPEALADFMWGKDIVDLLKSCPDTAFSAAGFIALCKPLAQRAYSISSSINMHSEEVHLTIGNVRYHSNDRDHNGVCSTFLADVATVGDKVACYFSPNKSFAVPEDDALPMIMIGPGTGIAPFRAFLEERQTRHATGDNWLFFGDRNAKDDFIYRNEIEAMQSQGLLTRLDLAFSRDQSEKIYVQTRMLEQGAELFAWLERGGYFYICGDAFRMAKDVDAALHKLIAEHGNMNDVSAIDYVNLLKKQKRYVRDVY